MNTNKYPEAKKLSENVLKAPKGLWALKKEIWEYKGEQGERLEVFSLNSKKNKGIDIKLKNHPDYGVTVFMILNGEDVLTPSEALKSINRMKDTLPKALAGRKGSKKTVKDALQVLDRMSEAAEDGQWIQNTLNENGEDH